MDEIRKIKLLIIDASSNDADLLMEVFENSNDLAICGAYELEVQWVNNLEDAKKRLKEFQYDMIFQGLDLSDTKSRANLKTLKAIAQEIPIIVTTGYINRKLWQEAFSARSFFRRSSRFYTQRLHC